MAFPESDDFHARTMIAYGAAWFGHSSSGGMFLWARLSGVLPQVGGASATDRGALIEMDGPSNTRRAARKAEGSRSRLTTEWLVIPLIIVLVFVLVFGLKFLLA